MRLVQHTSARAQIQYDYASSVYYIVGKELYMTLGAISDKKALDYGASGAQALW